MSISLIYVSNERIPGDSACSIQQVNMCAAFSRNHVTVTLLRPWYKSIRRTGPADLQRFYGITAPFAVRTLPTLLDLGRPEKKRRFTVPLLGGLSLMAAAVFYLSFRFLKMRSHETVIVYSRNVNATAVALWLRPMFGKKSIPVVYEAHSLAQQPAWLFRYVLRHSDMIVTISQALCRDLVAWSGKIMVMPDAIRQDFATAAPVTRTQARAALALPERFRKVVVYTGSAKKGKGVSVLLQAAALLPEDVLFVLVGNDLTLAAALPLSSHVLCVGFVAPAQVALYQCAADVLVLPNTMEGSIHRYTSPLKLYEYMAAKRPIVASDLPVLREVLQDGVNALLTLPGDVVALATAMTRLLQDDELALRLADHAYRQVTSCTWERRAEQIINQIKTLC